MMDEWFLNSLSDISRFHFLRIMARDLCNCSEFVEELPCVIKGEFGIFVETDMMGKMFWSENDLIKRFANKNKMDQQIHVDEFVSYMPPFQRYKKDA